MRSHKRIDKPLGQLLVERGVITNSQLRKSLEIHQQEQGLIGEIIVKLGFAKEEDIAYCLSLQYGFPYLPLENYEISAEVVSLVPKSVCSHYCLVLIDQIGKTLTIAMANPLNDHAIEDLEDLTSCDIQIFVSTPSDIRNCIDKFY
ncbi:MAG: hypothetical protein KAJ14_02795 [Candidatus Omnitrophica bacterium]|nr:hypothetical protein [Candidatus Omnitrophota bacterium]